MIYILFVFFFFGTTGFGGSASAFAAAPAVLIEWSLGSTLEKDQGECLVYHSRFLYSLIILFCWEVAKFLMIQSGWLDFVMNIEFSSVAEKDLKDAREKKNN